MFLYILILPKNRLRQKTDWRFLFILAKIKTFREVFPEKD